MRSAPLLATCLALAGAALAQGDSGAADNSASAATGASTPATGGSGAANSSAVPTPTLNDPLASANASAPFPTWVTNDYNCVMGCLSDWQTTKKPPVTPDMLATAYECVGSRCDNTTMAGNYYEAGFLIQLFNESGTFKEGATGTPGVNKTATSPFGAPSNASTSGHPSKNGTKSGAFVQAGVSWMVPAFLPALAIFM